MPETRNLPFHLDTGDWLKDPKLSMCAPAARGIWIDLLCALHESGRRGQITGTPDQLARLCRCSTAEFVEAIAEFKRTNAADISERNGSVTVINRRMQREEKARLATRQRVASHRSNADVTPLKRECNNQGEPTPHVYINNTSIKGISTLNGLNAEEKEKKQEKKEKSRQAVQPTVRAVFAYWQSVLGHPKAILTSERQRAIEARLRDGYTLEDLKAAIDGCKASAYHQGDNPQGVVYDGIDLVFRNGSKVEAFMAIKHGKGGSPSSSKAATYCGACNSGWILNPDGTTSRCACQQKRAEVAA